MYRICKVLNHNGVIALDMNDSKEYVLLGKGVGFGKKPGERFEQPVDCCGADQNRLAGLSVFHWSQLPRLVNYPEDPQA